MFYNLVSPRPKFWRSYTQWHWPWPSLQIQSHSHATVTKTISWVCHNPGYYSHIFLNNNLHIKMPTKLSQSLGEAHSIHGMACTHAKPLKPNYNTLYNTQFPLMLTQILRWQANGLQHYCNNGVAHVITSQALEDFPNINYKQYKWSVVHTSKTQTVTIIHKVNSTGLKPRSNPASQHFKRSIRITT